MPGLRPDPRARPAEVYGFILLAALVGVAYWFVLNRTRFGFDLRATGRSETAAVASGVNVKRMVLTSMLLSGAVAGLVGMPQLLGATSATASTSRPGSASPASPSPCSAATTRSASPSARCCGPSSTARAISLQTSTGIAQEIVVIMQGVIVLSVVIAYELVRRYRRAARAAQRGQGARRRAD